MSVREESRAVRNRNDLRTLPLALVSLTVAGLCWTVGLDLEGLLAVGGALAIVYAGSAVSTGSLARRALGSVLFVGGILAVTAGIGTAVITGLQAGTIVGSSALAVVGVGGALAHPRTRWPDLVWTVRDSTVTSITTVPVITLFATGTAGVVASAVALVFVGVTDGAYSAFTSGLLLAAAAFVAYACVVSVVGSALPEHVPAVSFGDLVDRLFDLPTGVYYVAVLVLGMLAAAETATAFESVLSAMGPVGTVVTALLTIGVIHVVLALALGCSILICFGWLVSPMVDAWFGSYPLRTVALASGGVVVPTVVFVGSLVVPGTDGLQAIWAVVLVLVLVTVVEGLVGGLLAQGSIRWRHWLLLGGCGSLLVTTFLAAQRGISPLFVFISVAAAIAVWDVGEHTNRMRVDIGESVDSRQPELVHATATLVVGAVGVAIAAVAMYGLGAVSPPTERWQALAPLVLALVAVTVLLVSITTDTITNSLSGTFISSRSLLRNRIVVVALAILAALVLAAVVGALDTVLAFVLLVIVPLLALVFVTRLVSTDSISDFQPPPPGAN
ncbi:DUF7519 family protein [Natronosalvus vescus]|uniref:DUF7519 family protein n=1 Tax=Natronosalvus vescus TaxID=2953881 RepID=UPI0020901823|nr:hypothetical protein [Natronosalvus vescus]